MKIFMRMHKLVSKKTANKLFDDTIDKIINAESRCVLIDSRIIWPLAIVKDNGEVVETTPENMSAVKELLRGWRCNV